ncbi:unnamed protein product [Moneuplotes crassus]|uniref:Uncharacterized protein n=1 Tax=Euplotes crassus TaxID=5936 RepID=A0AAD2D862_EUPCR|nr:unnamed protein product [Moneuplotes crassus]
MDFGLDLQMSIVHNLEDVLACCFCYNKIDVNNHYVCKQCCKLRCHCCPPAKNEKCECTKGSKFVKVFTGNKKYKQPLRIVKKVEELIEMEKVEKVQEQETRRVKEEIEETEKEIEIFQYLVEYLSQNHQETPQVNFEYEENFPDENAGESLF